MKAFYFAADDNKLRYGDGRAVAVGTTHTVGGAPKLCHNGLHASTNIMDALSYAPGCQLYVVELGGELDVGDDKICATSRTYLHHIDATEILRLFARKQALINIEKIRPYCGGEDYSTILDYLHNGDESERSAAESAAESAESAARSAAWSAARSAVRSAAWSAARSAARSAESAARSAESAARSAESAARSAESAAESAELAAESAAESAELAARLAARSAAGSAAEEMLTTLIGEATGWKI